MSETCSLDFCDREATLNAKNSGIRACKGHYQQDYLGKTFAPFRTRKSLHRDENGRVCTTCENYQSWDEFYNRSNGAKQSECRTCMTARETKRQADREAAAGPCIQEGCSKPGYLKGMCRTHYGRDYYERKKNK